MSDNRVIQLNDIAKGDTVFVNGDFSIYEYQSQNGEPKKDRLSRLFSEDSQKTNTTIIMSN